MVEMLSIDGYSLLSREGSLSCYNGFGLEPSTDVSSEAPPHLVAFSDKQRERKTYSSVTPRDHN